MKINYRFFRENVRLTRANIFIAFFGLVEQRRTHETIICRPAVRNFLDICAPYNVTMFATNSAKLWPQFCGNGPNSIREVNSGYKKLSNTGMNVMTVMK